MHRSASVHDAQRRTDDAPEGISVMESGKESKAARGMRQVFEFVRNDMLRGAVMGGVVMVGTSAYLPPELERIVFATGVSLIIAGSIGVYMMRTTRKISTQIFDGLWDVSDKLDTVSGKLDTVSSKIDKVSDKLDTVSGKLDTVSSKIDKVSDKLDTVSGKLDTQTGILREIRDAVVNLASARQTP